MRVEVIYALPERCCGASLQLPVGATVADAIAAAARRAEFETIDLAGASVGVFGRPVPLEQVLTEDDRVEIYRPLLIDAKRERRSRVAEARNASRKAAR